ncbi:efflux RND transporter periplasmic adaptor subunit [Paracoccus aerodenitrificans]|uniref:efflux RND transporter periplasmic adaptor subunit n=1 Tax=Paracoccus aerodenitrificans TaxID=3017781 RepID=UPI0022EFEC59|nr:efflux RND transporter periplasmic adaptor subunit [Paracoccus aerodenitrificans]WBU64252.1 efflux RND transporter periplasmic adaptor subunit [Paracoccus aerodenitrificans]
MQFIRASLLGSTLLLGLVPGLATAQEEGGAAAQQAPAPTVVTQRIEVKPVTAPETFTATVEAIERVNIQARIQGFIEEVLFEPGQVVQAGDPLFNIERAQYEAQVASAEASLAQAEAQQRLADQEQTRQQALVNRNASAEVNLEQAQANFQVAQANVQAAQSSVRLSEINLGYTDITSPITGKIGRALITQGNFVGPSAGTLAEIVQLDPIRVVFSLSEQLLLDMQQNGMVEAGQDSVNFNLELSNGSLYPHTGRLDFIDNQVDPATGTIPVRLIYDNPEAVLMPGQFATIVVSEKDPQELPIVPQPAVLQDRDGRYVFVVGDDNRVEQRRIATGASVDRGWAVTEGLEGGESVVVQGVQRLQGGMEVTVSELPTGDADQAGAEEAAPAETEADAEQ